MLARDLKAIQTAITQVAEGILKEPPLDVLIHLGYSEETQRYTQENLHIDLRKAPTLADANRFIKALGLKDEEVSLDTSPLVTRDCVSLCIPNVAYEDFSHLPNFPKSKK